MKSVTGRSQEEINSLLEGTGVSISTSSAGLTVNIDKDGDGKADFSVKIPKMFYVFSWLSPFVYLILEVLRFFEVF